MACKTVLIVEDQIDFLAINKRFLERHGYQVLAAEDGEDGVRLAREHQPQLILMDLSVPRLDGLGATRLLREDPETERIPIILLTAHSYGSVGRRMKAAGCDGYLAKPCDPRRVLEEVVRFIGEA